MLCVTLMDFLPLIKWVTQLCIKGKLFLERKRGREKDIYLFMSESTDNFNSYLQNLDFYQKIAEHNYSCRETLRLWRWFADSQNMNFTLASFKSISALLIYGRCEYALIWGPSFSSCNDTDICLLHAGQNIQQHQE